MQSQRQPALGDGRVLGQPEQLLDADVQRRRAGGLVVDGVAVARGRLEVRRRFLLQPSLQVPGQQRVERGPKVIGAHLRDFRLVG